MSKDAKLIKTTPSNPSEEQVKAWKDQYGKIQKAVLTDDEGNNIEIYAKTKFEGKFYMLEQAQLKLLETKSVLEYNKYILLNTILNDNVAELLSDIDVLQALGKLADKVVNTFKVVIAKA